MPEPEVHPDPSTFGQPEVAPVAAPAPAEPAPAPVVAPVVEAPVAPAPAPAPVEPAPDTALVDEVADEAVAEVLRRVEDGWHVLSGLSNGVTTPPVKR